jgi:hypothetical protein
MLREGTKMLDDDLDLLAQIVGMKGKKADSFAIFGMPSIGHRR